MFIDLPHYLLSLSLSLSLPGFLDFGGAETVTVTLSQEAGAVSCADIPIIDDSIFESVEEFQVQLTTDGNSTTIQLGDITMATVLIDDLCKWQGN